ncbi:peptidoglycan-binding protein [Streptomyces chilikensis]|uniref:Peptidoglycan-binding protein n=1 Tax=Streptomyces chilikensis TaxID=1194079 RepID=A0ABV3EYT4_9ACTN
MTEPAFEEFDPAGTCDCAGCAHWRRVMPGGAAGSARHPAAARVVTVTAAAATAVTAAPAVAAPAAPAPPAAHRLPDPVAARPAPAPTEPGRGARAGVPQPGGAQASTARDVAQDGEPRTDTEQAGPEQAGPAGAGGSRAGAAHDGPARAGHARSGAARDDVAPVGTAQVRAVPGAGEGPSLRAVSRSEIIERARNWTDAGVPYDMTRNWSDGYRQDCSGFVSMAWNLPGSAWTGNLDDYAERIGKDELRHGDILLLHDPADPQDGSHVVIFGGWTDYTHTRYVGYEQTRPHAVRRVLDYPYPVNADRYVPHRYRALAPEGADGPGSGGPGQEAAGFPGRAYFGPGAGNAHIVRLGRMLAARGGARFGTDAAGPRWTEAHRRATRAFQRAQGWAGEAADGIPGPHTWRLLVTGGGRDIPPAGTPSSHGVTGYPGRAAFRPGARNAYVARLGRQLVRKGYGRHYAVGPGPEWTDADRRAVRAFQRDQGWRGGAADGYPGPETWRRIFS